MSIAEMVLYLSSMLLLVWSKIREEKGLYDWLTISIVTIGFGMLLTSIGLTIMYEFFNVAR